MLPDFIGTPLELLQNSDTTEGAIDCQVVMQMIENIKKRFESINTSANSHVHTVIASPILTSESQHLHTISRKLGVNNSTVNPNPRKVSANHNRRNISLLGSQTLTNPNNRTSLVCEMKKIGLPVTSIISSVRTSNALQVIKSKFD